jgi:hypothetical protein
MSKPPLPHTTADRVHTESQRPLVHAANTSEQLPTDHAHLKRLRNELMSWAETTPGSGPKEPHFRASGASSRNDDQNYYERPQHDTSATRTSIPVYRVKREPPPSTLSRLSDAAVDAFMTVGDYCQRGYTWCTERISDVSQRVRNVTLLSLKPPNIPNGQLNTQREHSNLIQLLREVWWTRSAPQHPPFSPFIPRENDSSSRIIVSPSSSSSEATTAVKEAIFALAEAIRTTEKKRANERAVLIEERRKDLEKAIEHLRSHDSGPTNPILRDLIIAMSSDYAPMSLEVAEEILRIAELKEQEALSPQ